MNRTRVHAGRGGIAFFSVLGALAGVLGGIWVLAASVLYFSQDGMIFPRQGLAPGEIERVRREFPDAEETGLAAPDGVVLRGWLVKGRGQGPHPLLIYFGGNAEEVSTFIPQAEAYAEAGWSVLLMNYRGYGASGGSPGEKELFEDAALIYDAFSGRDDVEKGHIAVMGRSLGTGVAVYLASMRRVSGVVLVSPYDSLAAVAGEKYPVVPVSLLLRHRFDSLSRAPSIDAPMLAVLAGEDRVISRERSMALIEKWGGRRTLVMVEGEGHNSVGANPAFREAVVGFLKGLEAP